MTTQERGLEPHEAEMLWEHTYEYLVCRNPECPGAAPEHTADENGWEAWYIESSANGARIYDERDPFECPECGIEVENHWSDCG